MLNVKYFCGIQNINSSDIYNKLEVLLNNNKILITNKEKEYGQIYQSFHRYGEDISQVNKYLTLKPEFEYDKEIDTNEFIDYHGLYHKVMKELFLFNRMWSKEKLFCDSFNKRSKYVKYKLRNYYTRNFQRPIVYPVLDYKYRYPEFSFYKMTDNFFMTNSNEKNEEKIEEDDYNFNLDCPIFDDLVKKYHIKLFNQININDYIYLQAFNICLVKQSYHVKGTLFLFILKDSFKIIFFSNPYDFKSGDENAKKCNKKN